MMLHKNAAGHLCIPPKSRYPHEKPPYCVIMSERTCKFFRVLASYRVKAKTRRAVIAIDDKRILLLLNQRDEQALRDTAAQYGALCRSAARDILGSEQDAEECMNDALLTVWNRIPPDQPQNFCAYLLKIVRNAALDRFRSRQRGKRGGGQAETALEELAELLPNGEDVERDVERRELLAAITRFLEGLPQKQRDLFVRRYWRFSPFSDLARDFGMTENNVQVTLSRLRKKLLTYLRKEGLL